MATLHLLLCCASTLLLANALDLQMDPSKSKPQYTPYLVDDMDAGVELPLDVSEDVALPAQHSLPPPWLQFDEPPQKQRISSGLAKAAFIKLPPSSQHKHGQGHGNAHKGGLLGGERRCSIEISSKIPGVCQPMSHIGSACISGEYMEVLSAECM